MVLYVLLLLLLLLSRKPTKPTTSQLVGSLRVEALMPPF